MDALALDAPACGGRAGLYFLSDRYRTSEALTKHGVHNVYFESPATEREWLAWRQCLDGFAPRLFK